MIYLQTIEYQSDLYQNALILRQSVLRTPLGLDIKNEDLSCEKRDFLIAAVEKDTVVGFCLVRPISATLAQIKQVAVDPQHQKQGLGKRLMQFAHTTAKQAGFSFVTLDARKVAWGFYTKLGYQFQGEEFTEVGIPHKIMTFSL